MRYIPGIAGALLIVAGATVIWWPLGLIVLGAALLLVDRRIS